MAWAVTPSPPGVSAFHNNSKYVEFLQRLIVNFEALLLSSGSRKRHTICDENVVLKRAFQKCMTGGGSPKGRPQICCVLGQCFHCIPISCTSIPSPFSPHALPLPLSSLISARRSPVLGSEQEPQLSRTERAQRGKNTRTQHRQRTYCIYPNAIESRKISRLSLICLYSAAFNTCDL